MVKKVVIFGANGNTGLCAVEAAVQKGLQVRAFVRDPKKLPTTLADKVEVFKGNVLEPDSVNDAIEGMDAVVICLGTGDNRELTSDTSSHKVFVEVNPTTTPGRSISKHDLGKFLVDSLDDSKYYKTVIGLANKVSA